MIRVWRVCVCRIVFVDKMIEGVVEVHPKEDPQAALHCQVGPPSSHPSAHALSCRPGWDLAGSVRLVWIHSCLAAGPTKILTGRAEEIRLLMVDSRLIPDNHFLRGSLAKRQ